MSKYFKISLLLFLSLILTACAIQPPLEIAQLPQHLKFGQTSYYRIKTDALGKVIRAIYRPLPPQQEAQDRCMEIFQDLQQNFSQTDPNFLHRKALRQRTFEQNGLHSFYLNVTNQQLVGFIVYPPIPQMQNYQVDVFRGKNIKNCGFIQIQYSQIIPLSNFKNTSQQQIQQLRQQIAIPKLADLLKMPIPWRCNAK